jgi:hypothetical protein
MVCDAFAYHFKDLHTYVHEEFDDPAGSALWRVTSEAKQRWSVIGWVTKNLLSRVPWLRKARKQVVPAAFVVVSTQ